MEQGVSRTDGEANLTWYFVVGALILIVVVPLIAGAAIHWADGQDEL